MKNLRDYLIVAGLLLSSTAFSQTPGGADVPASASHYKTYHGDGIDDVLQYVPMASVFGLKLLGVEAESSWKRRLTVTVVSFGLNAGVTYGLKHTIHKMRPDGTDNRSFPSGHTSIAFCGATSLMHEYRKISPWIGVAGYALATGVAVDRIRRNRHHWGDVVAGAAIGVASAEAGYLIGDLILGKKKKNGGENVRESQNHLNSTTDNDGHISGKSTTDKLDNISLSVSPTGLAFAMKL
nr:phosphatase PAP2 family protein [Prevotella sp.]